MPERPVIAVVGSGLVGRGWAVVFARAGCSVRLWDTQPDQADKAVRGIAGELDGLAELGLAGEDPPSDVLGRIAVASTLEAALDGAAHVQECAPEVLATKQAVFAQLDAAADRDTVLASSTSGIRASLFSESLTGRSRCLVAHPLNPPHLIPLVELVPAPWTDPAVVERTRALMEGVGQATVTLKKEVPGFVVNRLQGALLHEAFRLVQDGVADVADVDAAVESGLGLRWSFMGPLKPSTSMRLAASPTTSPATASCTSIWRATAARRGPGRPTSPEAWKPTGANSCRPTGLTSAHNGVIGDWRCSWPTSCGRRWITTPERRPRTWPRPLPRPLNPHRRDAPGARSS